tara:strand:- start:1038 stop:1397 length:360 start_codon:yes stop_codon:yes gene_type:complete
MDAEQRYIEVDFTNFQVDTEFLYMLESFSRPYGVQIAYQLERNAELLPEKDGWLQYIAGVVKLEEPMFFEVEFLKQTGEVPVFTSLKEIEVDEYLDNINLNQILKDEDVQDYTHQTNTK